MSKRLFHSINEFADEMQGDIANSDALYAQQEASGELTEVSKQATASLRKGLNISPEMLNQIKYDFILPEFVDRSKLFIPRGPQDEGNRPLVGPSGGEPPISLFANGRSVNRILPNTEYEARIQVKNGGDMYLSTANLELYRHPNREKPKLEFKTEHLSFIFKRAMVRGTLLKGTISYGDHLRWELNGKEYFLRVVGVLILEENQGSRPSTRTIATNHTSLLPLGHTRYNLWLEVGDLLNDMKQLDDAIGTIYDAPDYNPEERMFRFRVQHAFTNKNVPADILLHGKVEQGFPDHFDTMSYKIYTNKIPGQRRRRNISRIKGELNHQVNNPSSLFSGIDSSVNTFSGGDFMTFFQGRRKNLMPGDLVLLREPKPFTPSVRDIVPEDKSDEPVFIGQSTFNINGHEHKTVSVRFRTGDVGSDEWNRKDYKLMARIYSIHPVDMPESLDHFDSSMERRVATTLFAV